MTDELEVPAALAGERVDRAVALLTGWARGDVQAMIDAREVLVGGRAVSKSFRLAEGDLVQLLAQPGVVGPPRPDPGVDVVVRHEDADLLVVAKPAGLVVHPGAGHADGTLVNGLLARYPELAGVGDPSRPGIVHRLDRDTSGLLAVARSQEAYEGLVGMLAAHDVDRRYIALAWGTFEAGRGVIEAPIGRSVRQPTRMAVRASGRAARTGYEVIRAFPAAGARPDVTLLECRLETGRTHQIRVHLQAVGHPVVGDATYGGARDGVVVERPFLHAGVLGLLHPLTGSAVHVEEPLPPDLVAVLERLG
jgi:23S rRNA pseudouridine1911/1915/1917 synthase